MIASINEMNTRLSRPTSRTRRSWQRRCLAVLVVSAYLLQCATADVIGSVAAVIVPKLIGWGMQKLPQFKSWASKTLAKPCRRCNPKGLAPGDELAAYLKERGIVLLEDLNNQSFPGCTSCKRCGGDGFVHISDRMDTAFGNCTPADEDIRNWLSTDDAGARASLIDNAVNGALAFLPAVSKWGYDTLSRNCPVCNKTGSKDSADSNVKSCTYCGGDGLVNKHDNGCPNCVCTESKKRRKDCDLYHVLGWEGWLDFSGGKLGKCKTTPCSDCAGFTTPNPFFSLLDKTYRKRRLMERLQGSFNFKPASHGRRLCAHTSWWSQSDCQKCEDQWLKKHDLKVSTYTPPSFLQNLKNQVLFQVDFTWNTRLSNAELCRMIAKTDGLATYACDTILHNVCDLTGTETDDVKDLFIGLKTGDMRMAIENICDICVDKAQDITGIEARTCINLLKNVCLRRWKAARQDINKIGTDVVCRQCNVKQDELKDFIADPTAVTAVNICAGIMKTQIERVCPIIRCLPAFNIEFRRRLTQLEPAVASTTTDSK